MKLPPQLFYMVQKVLPKSLNMKLCMLLKDYHLHFNDIILFYNCVYMHCL